MNEQTYAAALTTVMTCFKLQVNDSFVFASDGEKKELSKAFESVCAERGIGFKVHVLESEDSYEPPEDLAILLNQHTAALIATKRSYTHSDAVRGARAQGLRVATSPDINEEALIAGLAVDYTDIAHKARVFADKLECSSQVHIKSPSGTDLRFSIRNQKGFAETGLYTVAGAVGNLPAGEASCGVDEETAEGRLVVNGSYPKVGKLLSPVLFQLSKGKIIDIKGEGASEIIASLDKQAPEARLLAELGIGLNPSFQLTGSTLLDEKVAGTLHFGFGNNVSFGGQNNVPYHADAVVTDAELFLDNQRLSTI